jgi:hypothetical protein
MQQFKNISRAVLGAAEGDRAPLIKQHSSSAKIILDFSSAIDLFNLSFLH